MNMSNQAVTSSRKHVVVIGGGISGLTAAYNLSELSADRKIALDITIVDARDRLGGVIHTIKRDGFLIDAGPDNFITAKPWAIALVKRLGLESELLPTNDEFRKALVVRNGKLLDVPEGFLLMAPTKIMPMVTTSLFSWPGKIRMSMEMFMPAKKSTEDESLAAFTIRRFGKEALDRIVQPLISGIYTARPERLSLKATMPRFLELEQEYGSVAKGMLADGKKMKAAAAKRGSGARYGMFVTLKEGLTTMVNALRDKLPTANIRLNTSVNKISKNRETADGAKAWNLALSDGTAVNADCVIVAGPAKLAGTILGGVDKDLSELLSSIQSASSAVVHFAYKREAISHPLDAFGLVVPMQEKRDIIAASFSSVKYAGRAPNGYVLLRAFMGGALQPELMERDDEGLTAIAGTELEQLLGIRGTPRFELVHRWNESMAQYDVGHLEKVAAIRKLVGTHKGLAVAGNCLEGVGIPDCILSGERAAKEVAPVLGLA